MVNEPKVVINAQEHKAVIPASQASIELVRIKGTWPFDLFPDTMIIEEKRIVIKRNNLLFSTTITMPMSRLTIFEVTHSILFSSIHITGYTGYWIEADMQWLSYKDAQKVKDIVDGIRLKDSESIEILQHDKKTLIKTFETLGQTNTIMT